MESASSSETPCYDIINAGPKRRFLSNGKLVSNSSAGGVNVNNLPRPSKEFEKAQEDENLNLRTLHRAFRSEDPALVRMLYGEPLGRPTHLVSDALRTFIWAAPGHDLIAVDYSGIQGALTAWLADEEWKLQAMREIIADPTRPDLYRRAAAGILNTTTDVVTKKHWARQLGKVSELALSFAGGPSALVSMAANYALRRRQLHDLYPGVWEAASAEAREKAEKRYERAIRSRKKSSADVLSREAWLMCSIVVHAWRTQNAAHVELWKDYENAMRDAVREPGKTFRAGKIDHLVSHGFLWRRLPSGRCMAYASPRLKDQVWAKFRLPDGSWSESEVADRDEAERLEIVGKAKIEGTTSAKVTSLGVDSQTQKLVRYALYGGLATENSAMGIEADVLRLGMLACESAGYKITLHAYDEIVAEVPHGVGSVDEISSLMLNLPSIYKGLPLATSGFRGKRYHK
jgi:DNA polymerase bacteriophage-type